MTKAELIDNVVGDVNGKGITVTKKAVKAVVDATLEQIHSTMVNGEEILLQPLGRFNTKFRKERKATNMVTKEKLDVPAKFVPNFNPSSELKKAVAELPVEKA